MALSGSAICHDSLVLRGQEEHGQEALCPACAFSSPQSPRLRADPGSSCGTLRKHVTYFVPSDSEFRDNFVL